MNNIFNEILSMALDGSVIIVAVILLRLAVRKMPKIFRKVLWCFAGLRLLIPFSFKSSLSLMPENGAVEEAVAEQISAELPVSAVSSISDYLPYFWVSICSILMVYGIVSFIKLKLKISDAVLDEGNIFLSEKIDSPFVCGFLKPKIYFPYNIDEQTKSCILQHERLHIKYGDHILKALGFFIVCIYWFNPLVWVAYFLFCKDIELACDEGVIKDYTEENRKKYASAILEVGVNKIKLSACPVAFGEVGIKERVMSAVNYRKVTKAFLTLCVILCIAVAACFMTEPADQQLTKKEDTPKKQEEIVTAPPTTEPVTEVPTTESVTEVPTTEPVTETATKKQSSGKKQSSKTTLSDEEIIRQSVEKHEKFMEEQWNKSQAELESKVAEINRQRQQSATQPATDNVIYLFPEVDSPSPNTPTHRPAFEGGNYVGYNYPSINDF